MYRSVSQSLLTGVLLMTGTAAMAESVLRVYCEGAAEGSKIYVNGKFKADCPSDIFIQPGDIKLRVVKKVDSEYERVFEKSFYLADNSAKKIEVQLSGPQLSEAAIKARKLKQEKQEKQAANAALIEAKKGNVDAMRSVAEYYRQGKGLPQSAKNASYWDNRATATEEYNLARQTLEQARAGNVEAMIAMAGFYEEGKGVKANAEKAAYWEKKYYDIKSKKALSSARGGSVDAMREISRYYAEGKGVEKNPAESRVWSEKADKTSAENMERSRQNRTNRTAQQELNQIEFFEYSKTGFLMVQRPEVFGEGGSISMTVAPISTTWGLFMDITSAPTKSSRYAVIKSRMASRPSTFSKPESMIARAYHQQGDAGFAEAYLLSAR